MAAMLNSVFSLFRFFTHPWSFTLVGHIVATLGMKYECVTVVLGFRFGIWLWILDRH